MGMNKQVSSLAGGDVYEVAHATRKHVLGTRCVYKDGREYRYVSIGEAMTVARVLQYVPDQFAIAATYFGVDVSTAPITGEGGAIGDRTIRVCVVTGTATMTANEYAGARLFITDGTGAGQCYVVQSNEANGASTAVGYKIVLEDKLAVALDNTSVGYMQKSKWQDLVKFDHANFGGDPATIAVGAAMVAGTTTNKYLWMQTKGDGIGLAGTATVKTGSVIIPAEDVDGAVQIPVATENIVQGIGHGMSEIADTKFGHVYWNFER